MISARHEPRSYNVVNEKGNTIRRNRWQLLPTNETFEQEINYADDSISNDGDYQDDIGRDEVNVEQQSSSNNESTNNSEYKTRYGRLSKKPVRYGYNN